MPLIDEIKQKFPLHLAIWNNDYSDLQKQLQENSDKLETLDPRKRTPLMLAVTLGHLECVRLLLRHGCNVNVENQDGWTVVQEATATGDPDILSSVLTSRDEQRASSRVVGVPNLLSKLSEAPDFYAEMKWEFTSWVPLVSRMCPSDTYRVYKKGSSVRIDTTLLGFEQTQWKRGSRSYVFKNSEEGAVMLEIDHDSKQVYAEVIEPAPSNQAEAGSVSNGDFVTQRLKSPVVTTYIDTDKISFERDKKGIWGWRSDKWEEINGYECKVFSASNVELVTKTRTEHLNDADKARMLRSNSSPIESFLNLAKVEENQKALDVVQDCPGAQSINPTNISLEEYFDPDFDLESRDIGRPKEITSKIQKFKGHLWLSEHYVLDFQEQVMPIVDLMAISSSHFAKLKDFIQMQLPSGFPVKIEIPLFHVLTARITFGNIFAIDEPIEGVSTVQEEDRRSCHIDDSIFETPPTYVSVGYSEAGAHQNQLVVDEDDALLQFAIQQSILESSEAAGTTDERVDIWEVLGGSGSSSNVNSSSPVRGVAAMPPPFPSLEDTQLQRAIEESLGMCQQSVPADRAPSSEAVSVDDDLALALSLSQKQQEEDERRRQQQEDDMLQRILELSLAEK